MLIHRVNGVFVMNNVISDMMTLHERNAPEVKDFLLEYSLLVNTIKTLKLKAENEFETMGNYESKNLYDNIRPNLVRYCCFYESIEEFKEM
jgi:hypothetical protein